MSIRPHFPLHQNFLDPQSIKDKDGKIKPYGPIRFKQIVQERYLISKNINTSYNDTGKITPTERRYLLEFMAEEAEKTKKYIEEKRQQSKQTKTR